MVGYSDKNKGYEVEEFVKDFFERRDFETHYINSFYDLRVVRGEKEKKIEIKSCNLLVDNGGGKEKLGRFDFTDIVNRKKQRTHNVVICFVLVIEGTYKILGFMNAKTFDIKRRYIPVKEILTKRRYASPKRFLSKFD